MSNLNHTDPPQLAAVPDLEPEGAPAAPERDPAAEPVAARATGLDLLHDEAGVTTIEYAMACLAAAALAAVLYAVVTSGTVHDAIEGIISDALSRK